MNNLQDKPALFSLFMASLRTAPHFLECISYLQCPNNVVTRLVFKQLTHRSALVYAAFSSHHLSFILLSHGLMP